jgi:hypothetical protein
MSRVIHSLTGANTTGYVVDLRNLNPVDTDYNEVGFVSLRVNGTGGEYFVEFVTVADGGTAPTAPTVAPTQNSAKCVNIKSGQPQIDVGYDYGPGYTPAVHGSKPLATHLRVWCVTVGTGGVLDIIAN